MSTPAVSHIAFRPTCADVFSLLTAVLAIVGLTASAWAWLTLQSRVRPATSITRTEMTASASSSPFSAEQQEEEVAQAIVVTVRPARLEPSALTLPPGKYLLVVQNRSGLRDVTFRIDRERGERLHEAHDPRRGLNWSKWLNLTPGVYVLIEANHPEWNCRINITAH